MHKYLFQSFTHFLKCSDPIRPIEEHLTSEELEFLKASHFIKQAACSIHTTVTTWTRDQYRDYYQNVLDVFNYEQVRTFI